MKLFIDNRVYNELWKVLEIKEEVKRKIPEKVLKHIYKNALKSGYKFECNDEKSVLKEISPETFHLYISLYLQYVANDHEKQKIKDKLIKNEMDYKAKFMQE